MTEATFNQGVYHKHWTAWCSSNALQLYSGSYHFVYRPAHRPSWLKFLLTYLRISRRMPEKYVWLGYEPSSVKPFPLQLQQRI